MQFIIFTRFASFIVTLNPRYQVNLFIILVFHDTYTAIIQNILFADANCEIIKLGDFGLANIRET